MLNTDVHEMHSYMFLNNNRPENHKTTQYPPPPLRFKT